MTTSHSQAEAPDSRDLTAMEGVGDTSSTSSSSYGLPPVL